MKLLAFIKSPAGSLTIFVLFVAVGGVMILRSNARERSRAEQLTNVESAAPSALRESIVRAGQPLNVPARATPSALERAGTTVPEAVDSARSRALAHVARWSRRQVRTRPALMRRPSIG